MSCVISSIPVPKLQTLAEKKITSLYDFDNYHQPYNVPFEKIPIQDISLRDIKLAVYEDLTDNNDHVQSTNTASTSSSALLSSMKSEINRLNSFQNRWTVSYIKSSDLAAAGLFYLGDRDRVQCAFCRGIISDWEVGDDPIKEHVSHFPMCSFLLGCEVGNIPVSRMNGTSQMQSRDSFAERTPQQNRTEFTKIPHFPHMNHIDRRIQTFSTWTSTVVRAELLAECGFFYSGERDAVTCFCCAGRLGNWEVGDNPWVEHAKYYPNCAYVKYIKGSSFIVSVRPPDIDPSTNFVSQQPSSEVSEDVNTRVQSVTSTGAQAHALSPSATELLKEETPGDDKSVSKHLCKICMDEGGRVAFLPCGHSLACPKCASAFSFCPMCRGKIEAAVRIYFD